MPPAARPDESASRDDWKASAQTLEAGLSAYERRAAYLQTQLNRVISSPPWKFIQRIRLFLDNTIFKWFPRIRKLAVVTVR